MKLHLACGDVYLDGYINCDINGILVGEGETVTNATDLEHYYRDRTLGHKQAAAIDCRMNLAQMPWDFEDRSVDEIVLVNGIEHFPRDVAERIIAEAWRVLDWGGRFLVDFPDIKATVAQYIDTDPAFCMRHIYGNHKDAYSVHHWGYTMLTFRTLLGPGWTVTFRPIVQHDYPVIGCEATKLGSK